MSPTRAVFLDALGTLVSLEAPAPRLAHSLGIPLDARVERAMRAEMSFYRDHSHEGHDAETLADLRARSAAVVSQELGVDVTPDQLMEAISFNAFDDAAP